MQYRIQKQRTQRHQERAAESHYSTAEEQARRAELAAGVAVLVTAAEVQIDKIDELLEEVES